MGMGGSERGTKMNKKALRSIFAALLSAASILAPFAPAHAATARIKDIVNIEGVRDNQLVGYGLVVGLNGTGDSLNSSPFTKQSLQAMLERLGVNTRGESVRTANVAAVMVTANLPAFSTQLYTIEAGSARLNYGLEKVRFPAPVKVSSKIRATPRIKEVRPVPAGTQVLVAWTVEAEGAERPVCIAESITLVLP